MNRARLAQPRGFAYPLLTVALTLCGVLVMVVLAGSLRQASDARAQDRATHGRVLAYDFVAAVSEVDSTSPATTSDASSDVATGAETGAGRSSR